MRVPIYVEFEGKNVLVIGGGGVGTFRAKKFLNAGANVKVLSLEFSDELKELQREGKVELVKGDVRDLERLERLIEKSNLVVVALPFTDLNDTIVELAKKYKTLVNLANDAKKTEVVIPFEGEFEGIRFAVTTEGKSGIVARRVKDLFLKALEEDEDVVFFLKAMDHLKKYMKSRNIPIQLRMKLYFAVSDDEQFRKLVKEGDVESAKKWAEKLVDEYVSGKRELNVKGIEF
ncbi:precorrin-2 dehydrogenase/sirohydrochlorin ferrochelatase family protein [Archaeoglobus profundus]|uniref:precorrin-2 dehydrogenase n=1 Tax=Archaeoglobus profundus (strain DSM 5631 / JCM 9629 / NBRC 100127 / Av18) TaxID=572546 RepID=D2RFL8_ARCPA|nr:bifunctional precorrin-2 dehydrogenase/sirohydrochlorin ferrochelatase [Archaeoglobus profundus]ADB57093.1 siroheme synthase [Archaeoglobus profundus DSM 5631]